MAHQVDKDMEAKLEQEKQAMLQDIKARLSVYEKHRGNLIPILQMIQERHGYLARESMEMTAAYLDLATCEVYGVATFYNQFRFHPPGKNQICVCLGTACHIRGGDIILENFERKLGIKDGETTPDREFSIQRVACVGCCALAPVALVNDAIHGHMAPSKVEGIMLGFEMEREKQAKKKSTKDTDE